MTTTPRIFKVLPLLALVLALAACDSGGDGDLGDGPGFDISSYTGAPYTGNARVEVTVPGEVPQSENDEGTAQVTDHGNGSASLGLTVGGESFITADGVYDDAGWDLENGSIHVSGDGQISGGGTDSHPQYGEVELTVDGDISDTHFDLLLVLVLIDGVGEVPPGTEINILFTLERGQPALTSRLEASAGTMTGDGEIVSSAVDVMRRVLASQR